MSKEQWTVAMMAVSGVGVAVMFAVFEWAEERERARGEEPKP